MIVVLDNGMKLRSLETDGYPDAYFAIANDATFMAETLEDHEEDRTLWRVAGSHVSAWKE